MNKHIITKEQFKSLFGPNIKKSDYDTIISKIDKRFSEIVVTLKPSIVNGGNWFVYGNYDYRSENDEGHFDPHQFEDNISIGGENNGLNIPFDYEFPTKWLWESDYLVQYNKEVELFKLKEEQRKDLEKAKKQVKVNKKLEMKQVIQSKLTKEELKYISFK